MGYIIFFAIVGGWLSGGTGFLIGIAIGFFYYRLSEAFRRIEHLTDAVAALEKKQADPAPQPLSKQQEECVAADLEEKWTAEEEQQADPIPKTPPKQQEKFQSQPLANTPASSLSATPDISQPAEAENFFTNLAKQLHKTSTVVRTGMVLLLFGLVFLFRYAAKNQEFTVETALMMTIGVGIVLLFMGWRLAERKRAYALMLQGGSVAVLFTSLFLSTEVYALFPVFVSFAAMIGLSMLAGLLAVRYDARETALIGMGGGFAAPLLSPVTSDQLIFLFSYYLLLAGGIFAVSRLRNWRVLHLLSCLFIIFVGLFLGQSEDISHVRWQLEPFLFLFFLFYTLTEFLFLAKNKEAWGNGMDWVLTLGPPAACLVFQAELSYPGAAHLFLGTLILLTMYYGLAAYWLQLVAAERLARLIQVCAGLSFACGNLLLFFATDSLLITLALLACYYGLTAYFLWRFDDQRFAKLVSICMALSFASGNLLLFFATESTGIIFALLTCYYGLTAYLLQRIAADRFAWLRQTFLILSFSCGNLLILHATGALISILIFHAEAVGWTWLAMRRRQELPFWFSMTLLFIPALLLQNTSSNWLLLFRSQPLLAASAGLSFCLSPFLCAILLRTLPSLESILARGLLLWSSALWLIGGAVAISKTVPADWSSGLILLFISISFGMLRFGAQRLSWAFMNQLCNGFSLILGLIAVNQAHEAVFSAEKISAVFVLSSSVGWLISLAAYYSLLLIREEQLALSFRTWQHRLGGWLVGGIIVLQTCNAAKAAFQQQETWLSSTFGLAAGAWIILLLIYGKKLRWPVRKYQLEYLGYGIMPFAAAAWLWTLNACLSLGDPSPLKYVPLLNPIETAQGICLLALFLWAKELKQPALQALPLPTVARNNMGIALYGTLFLCLTMMITRSICYYTHISFSAVGILSSPFLQTIISVIWSGAAFIIMLFSARAKRERENSLGTLLLFLVAAKLFLVDIHLSNELERICSFIWVGGIMLLAGYYMPAENAAEHAEQ